jgi:hypothetical protein
MVRSRIIPGIRVLSSDGQDIGTVEKVRNDQFTIVDPRSNARRQVRFDRVQSVDEQIHLNCKATEVSTTGAVFPGEIEHSKGALWLATAFLVAVIVLLWWGWPKVAGMLSRTLL